MFSEWMKENLEDYAEDIATHGCIAGFPGLTYYTDTTELYDKFEDEIWEALHEDYQEFGYDNIVAFVGSFNGAENVYDVTTFKNLLVWYMAERVARDLCPEL